jgi:polyribonucleotide nucleotidyltransferase
MPGTEALLHISEMRHERTERTEDVVKKGDRVTVKLVERDERGRLRLSMKALLPKPDSSSGANDDAGASGDDRSAGAVSEEEQGSGGGRDRDRGRGRPRRNSRGGGRER